MTASSLINKTQTSFKQTTTTGSVFKDPVMLLQRLDVPDERVQAYELDDPWASVTARLRDLPADSTERDKNRLFAFVVTRYIGGGQGVPFDASEFFAGLQVRFRQVGQLFFASPKD